MLHIEWSFRWFKGGHEQKEILRVEAKSYDEAMKKLSKQYEGVFVLFSKYQWYKEEEK